MLDLLVLNIKEKIEKLNFDLEENSNILEKYRKKMSFSQNLEEFVHNEIGSETILFLLKERAVLEAKHETLSEILYLLSKKET